MSERKRRSDLLDIQHEDLRGILLEEESIELGLGYSISFDNSKETPTLYVKTYGDVDSLLLKRKLEQHYPGAKIEGLNLDESVKCCKDKKRPRKSSEKSRPKFKPTTRE